MAVIEVRQDHIDRGIKNSCVACPVALAIRETFAIPQRQIAVLGDYVEIVRDDQPDEIMLPGHVEQKIASFDAGRGMKPFLFRMRAPKAISE